MKRFEEQSRALEKETEKELEILDLKPNMRVLDAGCGSGAITRSMALKVHPAEACGIDIDPLFISEAKKLALKKGIKNIKFELANIDNLKYENGTFDLSYCRLVLMHVRDPVKTVAELKRVTKKGGTVAASDVDDGGMLTFPQATKFFNLWSKFGQREKALGVNRYIGRQLFSIFSEAGLRSINIHPFPMFATWQDLDALKMLISVPIQILEQDKDAMIREGFATKQDFDEAMKETRALLNHPGAFARE